jgi:precorrin-6B C5,15-methyltransferase / cobalt-precorrin-6B C5,C15-methyltransferase
MQQPWLTVIGIGEDGFDALSPIAHQALHQADLIIGGDRHLNFLPTSLRHKTQSWRSPLQASIDDLLTHHAKYPDQNLCILASGDPLCHGIGSTLLRSIPSIEMQIIPSLSAFTLARSRLAWSSTEVETLSLCGRDLQHLRPALYPNAKLLLLSSDEQTPNLVCDHLTEWGYGTTQVTVLENLGSPQETHHTTIAQAKFPQPLSRLNTIALQCPPLNSQFSILNSQFSILNSQFSILNSQFSIPDTAYRHDGQLTKQEIRTQTLAALAPFPGQLLWDVGAGCGSIAIEWMRHHPRNRSIAIESHPDRLTHIQHNAKTLGVPTLQIIPGHAPEVLHNLDRPDAIFIGGGITRENVFETCWTALKDSGKLVANGVTLETEMKLFQLQQLHGGHLTRIQIQRAEPIGNFLGWKSLSPITQWQVSKSLTG